MIHTKNLTETETVAVNELHASLSPLNPRSEKYANRDNDNKEERTKRIAIALESGSTVRVSKDDFLQETIQQDVTIETNANDELEANKLHNYCGYFNKANCNVDYKGENEKTKTK